MADLAAEYGLSEDCLGRHKANHLKVQPITGTLAEKWDQIYAKADELFRSANLLSDPRAATDALAAAMRALENGSRLRDANQQVGFEDWPVGQQVDWILADRILHRAILDRIIADCRLPRTNAQETDNHSKPV